MAFESTGRNALDSKAGIGEDCVSLAAEVGVLGAAFEVGVGSNESALFGDGAALTGVAVR